MLYYRRYAFSRGEAIRDRGREDTGRDAERQRRAGRSRAEPRTCRGKMTRPSRAGKCVRRARCGLARFCLRHVTLSRRRSVVVGVRVFINITLAWNVARTTTRAALRRARRRHARGPHVLVAAGRGDAGRWRPSPRTRPARARCARLSRDFGIFRFHEKFHDHVPDAAHAEDARLGRASSACAASGTLSLIHI